MLKDDIIKHILSLEQQANHPIADALCNYCIAYMKTNNDKVMAYENVLEFENIAGEGVKGIVNSKMVEIGNRRMAERIFRGKNIDVMSYIPIEWQQRGGTIGWVIINEEIVSVFILSGTVRPTAAEAMLNLKQIGVSVTMLTGDNKDAALAFAQMVNIPHVFYELLPKEKVDHVERLKIEYGANESENKGKTCFSVEHNGVAMIGDGVNDAPALATANVGIAMGVQGTAVAMETADVSLMDNDLRKIGLGIRLGRQVTSVIIQNVIFAVVCKIVMIVLTVLGLSALWLAIVVDVGSMLIVSLNSSRILKPVNKVAVENEIIKKGDVNHNLEGTELPSLSALDVKLKEIDDQHEEAIETDVFRLKIDEMEGLCDANLLQKALKKVDGVRHVDIDMANKTLSCQCEQGSCEITSLAQCVEGLGFDVEYNTYHNLKIDEMEGLCDANLLQNALKKVQGVIQVDVDMGVKTLNCLCASNEMSLKALTNAVEGLGFDYELV